MEFIIAASCHGIGSTLGVACAGIRYGGLKHFSRRKYALVEMDRCHLNHCWPRHQLTLNSIITPLIKGPLV